MSFLFMPAIFLIYTHNIILLSLSDRYQDLLFPFIKILVPFLYIRFDHVRHLFINRSFLIFFYLEAICISFHFIRLVFLIFECDILQLYSLLKE